MMIQFFEKKSKKLNEGIFSCQFLPPGDSMGPRYVLQLLFIEISDQAEV
jgi:hypothetical protein